MTRRATSETEHEERLAAVLEQYLAGLRSSNPRSKSELLALHPDLADDLEVCLASLDYVRAADIEWVTPADHWSSSVDSPARRLGDFRILGEIGRGGMGVVYEAEQVSLDRRVALKILPLAGMLDERRRRRFTNEAKAAALLHHQNIVPVYQIGCERGVHYFAMQYVEGQTLAELIQELRNIEPGEDISKRHPITASIFSEFSGESPEPAGFSPVKLPKQLADEPDHSCQTAAEGSADVSHSVTTTSNVFSRGTGSGVTGRKEYFRTVAKMGIQAAEALEHAHEMGIIHRDIKPSNLLVDAAGKIWITDFGLAHMSSESGLSVSGDLLGTVRYMSPEQARGNRESIDHRTDVYSLGATLYELLTLQPLIEGDNREELLRKISWAELRPPRGINKRVPNELDTIIVKAISKSPGERFASAQDMADDLRRYLDDRPIHATRPTMGQRLWKWIRRHQQTVVACSALILMVLLTIGPLVAWREAHRAHEAQNAARREANLRGQVQDLVDEQSRQLYVSRISLAHQAWESENNVPRVLGLLEQCLPRPGDEDLRGFEWFYLKRLCEQAVPNSTLMANHPVSSLSVSPDGRTLAVAGSEMYLYEGSDVVLWDLLTKKEIRRIPADAHCVEWSPDGQSLATGCFWSEVKRWTSVGRELPILHPPGQERPRTIRTLVHSRDGTWLAALADQTALLWNLDNNQFRELDPHSGVRSVAFAPNGKSVATGRTDGTIRLWSLESHQELGPPLAAHSGPVATVVFAPQGTSFASGGSDGKIVVWDSITHESERTLDGHPLGVTSVVFLDDRRLASAGNDKTVRVWQVETGLHDVLQGHGGGVTALAYADSMNLLISGSRDRRIKLWPLADARSVDRYRVKGLDDWAFQFIDLSPDSRILAVGGAGNLKLWDVENGHELNVPIGSAQSVTFSPDGRLLATTDVRGADESPAKFPDMVTKIWDTSTWDRLSTLPGCGASFSADGTQLLLGRQGLTLWDIRAPREPRKIRPIGDHVFKALGKFFPDRLWLAGVGSSELASKIWDARDGRLVAVFDVRQFMTCGAVAPDDTKVALGTVDGSVQIWDVTSQRKLITLEGHGGPTWQLDFSPDGKTLATGSEDGTVKLWNIATYSLMLTLNDHGNSVRAVRFSRDGSILATGSADGTVLLWRAIAPRLAGAAISRGAHAGGSSELWPQER